MIALMLATFLLLGSTAFGEVKVVVELVPDNPPPYVGGELLTVDVWLHSQTQSDFVLVLIQVDFTDSDPSPTLDPAFTFDFSSLGDQTNAYLDFHFPELPVPWTANLIMCFCPGLFLPFPAGGSLHIGSIGAQLPSAPGAYRLDLLNADEPFDVGGGAGAIRDHSLRPRTTSSRRHAR